jgi:putative endonuclease
MADHLEFGKKGETIAAEYLQKKGYKIIDTNWRSGKNEIDIVAREESGKYVVVVEVKSRHSLYGGEPETAVTRDKQKSLIRAANAYVRIKNVQEEIRFDIISILITKEGEKINHIEDAFYPTL